MGEAWHGRCTLSPAGTTGNSEASGAQEEAWQTEHGVGRPGKAGFGSAAAKLSESQGSCLQPCEQWQGRTASGYSSKELMLCDRTHG